MFRVVPMRSGGLRRQQGMPVVFIGRVELFDYWIPAQNAQGNQLLLPLQSAVGFQMLL